LPPDDLADFRPRQELHKALQLCASSTWSVAGAPKPSPASATSANTSALPAGSLSSSATASFRTVRQLGGAIGVAILTEVIVAVGPVRDVGGHPEANLTSYRLAFLVAAAFALLGTAFSLKINDSDAARTIPALKRRRAGTDRLQTALAWLTDSLDLRPGRWPRAWRIVNSPW
jgi:hypothetical protein